MITLKETKEKTAAEPRWRKIPFFDFYECLVKRKIGDRAKF
jgi:hypothetical protein